MGKKKKYYYYAHITSVDMKKRFIGHGVRFCFRVYFILCVLPLVIDLITWDDTISSYAVVGLASTLGFFASYIGLVIFIFLSDFMYYYLSKFIKKFDSTDDLREVRLKHLLVFPKAMKLSSPYRFFVSIFLFTTLFLVQISFSPLIANFESYLSSLLIIVCATYFLSTSFMYTFDEYKSCYFSGKYVDEVLPGPGERDIDAYNTKSALKAILFFKNIRSHYRQNPGESKAGVSRSANGELRLRYGKRLTQVPTQIVNTARLNFNYGVLIATTFLFLVVLSQFLIYVIFLGTGGVIDGEVLFLVFAGNAFLLFIPIGLLLIWTHVASNALANPGDYIIKQSAYGPGPI